MRTMDGMAKWLFIGSHFPSKIFRRAGERGEIVERQEQC
jgi:hypothetical protein